VKGQRKKRQANKVLTRNRYASGKLTRQKARRKLGATTPLSGFALFAQKKMA
jgi:hypothetical protein